MAKTSEDGLSRSAMSSNLSESSTPRAGMTPVGGEVSVQPVNATDASKNFARMLNNYTNAIVIQAQNMTRFNDAEAVLYRSLKDDKKWQDRYPEFAALKEMQSRTVTGAKKRVSKSQQKIDAIKGTQKIATAQLAANLSQVGGSTLPRSSEVTAPKAQVEMEGNSPSLERVEAELIKLRGDFGRLTKNVNDTKSRIGQAEFLHGKQSRLENDFGKFEHDFGKFEHDFGKIKDRVSRVEQRADDISANTLSLSTVRAYEKDAADIKLAVSQTQADKDNFEHRLYDLETTVKNVDTTKLVSQVNSVEDKTKELESTTLSLVQDQDNNAAVKKTLKDLDHRLQTFNETYEKQCTEIKNAATQQSEDLYRLNSRVCGDKDSNEPSLFDMISDSQADVKKVKAVIATHDNALDDCDVDLDKLNSRMNVLDEQLARQSRSSDRDADNNRPSLMPDTLATIATLERTTSRAASDISQLREDVTKLSSERTQLIEDLEQFDKEQTEKDDLVGKEVDRLDNFLIRHEDILNRICERIGGMGSRNVSEAPSAQAITLQQSALGTTVQQMKERLEKLETLVIKRDDSYDSLNQEIKYLRSTVQGLPPLDSYQQIHHHFTQYHQAVPDLIGKVNFLQNMANSPSPAIHSPRLTNGVVPTGGVNHHVIEGLEHKVIEALEHKQKEFKEEFDGLQSSFKEFKEATTDTTNTHDTFITSLQHRFDNLTTDQMARYIIHQMQLIYPNHPANVQTQLHQLHQRQTNVEGKQTQSDQRIALIATQLNSEITNGNTRTLQIEKASNDVETIRHQIVLRATETTKLIDEAKDELKGDFQRRFGEANEGVKRDFNQRIKVAQDEWSERYSVVEQDIRSHLERIQNLQTGVQKIRTDLSSNIADLTSDLRDVQSVIKNLAEKNALQQLRTQLENVQAVVSNSNEDAKLDATRTALEEEKKKLEEVQNKVDDMWQNFIKDMVKTNDEIVAMQVNIQTLNDHFGIQPHQSRATSRPETVTATIEPDNNLNASPPGSSSPPKKIKSKSVYDISSSPSPSPTQQLSQSTTAAGRASLSRGRHSDPSRGRTTEHTPTQEDSDDSEPIAPMGRKRRKIKGMTRGPNGTPRGKTRRIV